MSSHADQDLNLQQEHLSSTSYDLRITNLARFIYKKISSTRSGKNPSFLDVGAGNGLFLKYFIAHGFDVSGYELEQKNIDNMKKDPVLKSVSIAQADITNLRGSENFDVVMASDVIEHIKDDVLAIKNLWSFVKPGGLVIITVPAHSYLYGKRDEKWGHHRRYDRKILLRRIDEGINDKTYQIEFATQWNIVGYFVYFLFEKILHKPINEKMRYSPSLSGRISRSVIEGILRLEEMIGGLPLGLTLVVGVRKKL